MVRFKFGVEIGGREIGEFFHPVESKKKGKDCDTWRDLI
jgi:hypothetical protein